MNWWLAGKSEIGPDYCKACTAKPNSFTHCSDCVCPEILPENKNAIELFVQSDTQWRYYDKAPPVLDYVAVKVVADGLGIEWDKSIVQAIKTLECAAVEKRLKNMKDNNGNA